MLISYNWLNEFLELTDKNPAQIAEALTLSTAEVEGISQYSVAAARRSPGESGNLKDHIIEIDNKSLTHRPDLWGHIGIARELSAIFHRPLKDRYNSEWIEKMRSLQRQERSPVTISVDSRSSCLGYFGITINGVSVEESPAWMQSRLNALGLRPINNMVDIGNYVMLELGHPMHIFDREQIHQGKIVVQLLDKPGVLKMLDGTEAKLIAGDTVVADPNGPLVLGGIMGGEASGVSGMTNSIFIEVANWKFAAVRRTSVRLGLRTDSSMRYEKSLDSRLMERTLFRAVELVLTFCPGANVVGKLEYDGPALDGDGTLKIQTSAAAISKHLGRDVTESELRQILSSLDFVVANHEKGVVVTVPSFRATKDISCEADLVEEVGRIIGYNNIMPTAPRNDVTAVQLPVQRKLQRKVQDFFVLNAGAFEVMTYPLLGQKLLSDACWPRDNSSLCLLNSWSAEYDRPRPSLIPSLLQAAALNQKTYEKFTLFEIGRIYLEHAKEFREERTQVGFAFFHREASQFIGALDAAERLLKVCGAAKCAFVPFIAEDFLVPDRWIGTHPFQNQSLKSEEKTLGTLLSVTPPILKNFKIRGHLTLGIIDLVEVQKAAEKEPIKYREIPRFPQTTFDCTVVTPRLTPVQEVLDVVQALNLKQITEVKLVNIFEIDNQRKAVCARSFLSDPTKTLSGEELKSIEDGITAALINAGFPLR